MGFRTLAIEKRSGEVWQLLSAVKTEFGNFNTLLSKAQSNIQTGLNQLEDLAGKRTRAIEKRLKDVQVLSNEDALNILPELNDQTIANDEE
jgi:DNA recombination protein RmuC